MLTACCANKACPARIRVGDERFSSHDVSGMAWGTVNSARCAIMPDA